jgi:hypothetical protein
MGLEIIKDRLSKILPFNTTRPELPITLIPLSGDASDRQYYRISWNQPEIPSLILMKLAQQPSPAKLPFIQIQEHLASIYIPVPKIYGYYPEFGYLLLEDLGPITLENKIKNPLTTSQEVKDLYLEAIDILVRMQIYGSQPRHHHCPAFKIEFDIAKFMYELQFFQKYMIEELLNKKIAPSDQAIFEEEFYRLCQILAQEKKYFTHRDYHSRNIMVQKNGLGILDFQDARMGLCQYDLASLLRDSYVTLPDKLVTDLLEYYLEKKELLEGKKVEERARFCQLFDFTSLQRNLKALGTFSFQKVEKNRDEYLAYIPPTLEYIWQNLDKYQLFNSLKRVLKKYLTF